MCAPLASRTLFVTCAGDALTPLVTTRRRVAGDEELRVLVDAILALAVAFVGLSNRANVPAAAEDAALREATTEVAGAIFGEPLGSGGGEGV